MSPPFARSVSLLASSFATSANFFLPAAICARASSSLAFAASIVRPFLSSGFFGSGFSATALPLPALPLPLPLPGPGAGVGAAAGSAFAMKTGGPYLRLGLLVEPLVAGNRALTSASCVVRKRSMSASVSFMTARYAGGENTTAS